jgi:hypothetical protein
VELTEAMLTDGPWCPDASSSGRYDADLLRLRRVRVELRVQVGDVTLRGASALQFRHPGTARVGQRAVPDYSLAFDIAPRNLDTAK